MDTSPPPSIPLSDQYIAVVYDVRILAAAKRFSLERAAWGESAEVEVQHLDHPVLIVRPGGARRCK